jgi:hypothetical protein
MILLDTVVLSELRKHDTSPQVIHWLTGYQDTDLFLSRKYWRNRTRHRKETHHRPRIRRITHAVD